MSEAVPARYVYASGFAVGDRVEIVPGRRTYNTLIYLKSGMRGTVVDPPNPEDWPDDAVQVRISGEGEGGLDAGILRKVVYTGQTWVR